MKDGKYKLTPADVTRIQEELDAEHERQDALRTEKAKLKRKMTNAALYNRITVLEDQVDALTKVMLVQSNNLDRVLAILENAKVPQKT